MNNHLKQLENESIHIIREAIATASNPAMLYSIGKDSSVMLHLALKAFYPAIPPFPLVHVDTLWKFKQMIEFRDKRVKDVGMELIVYSNKEGVDMDISPFVHGSKLHTDIMKTDGLKQVLNKYKFDCIFGGARRDEEVSRAKERIFSFRNSNHTWNPKEQRPEPFNLFNTNLEKQESFRVFPLSNWTEKDIWAYIKQEDIEIVPLYFAKQRDVFEYDGMTILADDDRVPDEYKQNIKKQTVRFRTLGCYPLTGAIHSQANTLEKIVDEMNNATTSERSGRAIDKDQTGSMEKKKVQGYF
jgi:sulfate adenylyltransferase subunit 2